MFKVHFQVSPCEQRLRAPYLDRVLIKERVLDSSEGVRYEPLHFRTESELTLS